MKPSEKMAAAKKRVRKDDYPTTGLGPWLRFKDQAFAAGEFRLDKITENWARHKEKQKESDARRAREKQEEQDNFDHMRAVARED